VRAIFAFSAHGHVFNVASTVASQISTTYMAKPMMHMENQVEKKEFFFFNIQANTKKGKFAGGYDYGVDSSW
jgi:hypothetical protein